MYYFLKTNLAFLFSFLFYFSVSSQHAIYINAGFRVMAYPTQSYTDYYGGTYELSESYPKLGIKMGAGLMLPTTGQRNNVELELAYSLHSVEFTRSFDTRKSSSPDYYSIAVTKFKGMEYFAESSLRFSRTLGKGGRTEIVAGLRFSFFYYDGRSTDLHSQSFTLQEDGLGNSIYVRTEDYYEYYQRRNPWLTFQAWPEVGIRTWCFKDGLAGFELNSGMSMSTIFTREDKIISYFTGLSYIRKWNRKKKELRKAYRKKYRRKNNR